VVRIGLAIDFFNSLLTLKLPTARRPMT
jgi:hypothetical protein